MSVRKIYVFIIFTWLLSTIVSCYQTKDSSFHEKKQATKPKFERQEELLKLLNHYSIPTDNSTVVLLPPSKCASCKRGSFKTIDTLDFAYVLAADSSHCFLTNQNHKIVIYDSELVEKLGLVKLYVVLFRIRDSEVVERIALTN
jgi:hypothetical protein